MVTTRRSSKEARTNKKYAREIRTHSPRYPNKDRLYKIISALILNDMVHYGKCRHNHDVEVSTRGVILIDGEDAGHVDAETIKAARFLNALPSAEIKYVRNSPIIQVEGEPILGTAKDVIRSMARWNRN